MFEEILRDCVNMISVLLYHRVFCNVSEQESTSSSVCCLDKLLSNVNTRQWKFFLNVCSNLSVFFILQKMDENIFIQTLTLLLFIYLALIIFNINCNKSHKSRLPNHSMVSFFKCRISIIE